MKGSITILQLKKSNERVFEQIVQSYWPRLYAFANIYIVDKETAKEITQDTFLTLWLQRENLTDDTCLITYLMVVCRNKCLNNLKSLQLETISIEELGESALYQRSNAYLLADDSLTILITQELTEAIDLSLERLPLRTKEIFMQSRYEGLKNKEIAEKQLISIKAVEFHISKALKQFRDFLSKNYFTLLLTLIWGIFLRK